MSTSHIEVVPASPEQQPLLANLLQLYIHDFSEFVEVTPGPDGRYDYPQLPLYWTDAARHPLVIRADGFLAGFALVRQTDSGSLWDTAEFFILRKYRRQGIGTQAAHALWDRFLGQWQVRVRDTNQPALHFWRKAVTQYAGSAATIAQFTRDDARWHVFNFESPAPVSYQSSC